MATNGWSKEKEDDKKVCFNGDKEKGHLIIKELERLGGVNSDSLLGDVISAYYYIDKDKEIMYSSFKPTGYTLKTIEDILTTPEKPFLEVGKWYKAKGISTEDLIYTKFHSLGKGDNPTFLGSEHIYVKNKRLSKPASPTWCFYLKDMEGLVDISEIQEYLPEGHVDKLPVELTELPEKWCIRGYEEVAKYSNKYGECLPYAENTYQFHHYPCYEPGCTTSSEIKEGYVEITLEQFKKWVLKEPLKDKKEFQIGKWYKINDCWYFKYKTQSVTHYLFTESISSTGEYSSSGGNTVKGKYPIELLTNLEWIKKYLPENHPDKIKKDESLVGRRVKALVDYPNAGAVKKDEIGIIYQECQTYYLVSFPSQYAYSIPKSDVYNLTKYELLDNVENVKHFQKGDYIVITGPGFNNHGLISDFCYKQRDEHLFLSPELTTNGSETNRWGLIQFNNDNWRYATQQEIAAYNLIGKPYDIKTLGRLTISPSVDIIKPIDCISNSKNLIFAKKKSKLLPFKKEEVVTVCLTTKNNKK